MRMLDKVSLAARHPILALSSSLGKSERARLTLVAAYLTDLPASTLSRKFDEALQTAAMLKKRFENTVSLSGSGAGPFSKYGLVTLYLIVRISTPELVVETGVAHGSSSACILAAMRRNRYGMLYSIDFPNAEYRARNSLVSDSLQGMEPGWLVSQDLRDRWKLIVGRSADKLVPLLRDLGAIDVFIHDSEHTYENMIFEYLATWPFLKPGGSLISDDIDWNGAFEDFAHRVSANPRVVGNLGVLRKAS